VHLAGVALAAAGRVVLVIAQMLGELELLIQPIEVG
jgi:hypothetical protein